MDVTSLIKGFIDSAFPEPDRIRYQNWINDKCPDKANGYCRKMTEAFTMEFPEFRMVGIQNPFNMGGHCWAQDSLNRVVDPTAHQFKGIYQYDTEYAMEADEFPKGKCMECGDISYYADCFCSPECLDIYSREVGW